MWCRRPIPHRRDPGGDPLPRARRQQHRYGRVIDTPSYARDLVLVDELGFAPWRPPAANCCSGSSPPLLRPPASASPAIAPPGLRASSCPTSPPPSASTTGSCTTSPRHHQRRELPHARGPQPEREPPPDMINWPPSGDLGLAVDRGPQRADTVPPRRRCCKLLVEPGQYVTGSLVTGSARRSALQHAPDRQLGGQRGGGDHQVRQLVQGHWSTTRLQGTLGSDTEPSLASARATEKSRRRGTRSCTS